MTGLGTIKQVSTGNNLPYNRLTVRQTWGREIPTINFITKPTLSLGDAEPLEVYRDGSLLLKCFAELAETTVSSKTYSGRLNPTAPMFRILKPVTFVSEPAWIIKALNQPVQAALVPFIKSRFDNFNDYAEAKTNWKIRGAFVQADIMQGVPWPWASNFPNTTPVGMTTDGHDPNGAGVLCFGMGLTSGVWLTCFDPTSPSTSHNAQIVVAYVKVLKQTTHRCFVGLMNSNPGAGVPGYILEVDFDQTTNNVRLLRVPNANDPGAWVVVAQSSQDLTAEIGQWVTLKVTRLNRGTLLSPNYYWKGGILRSDGTSVTITEVLDNTYETFVAVIGCRASSGAAAGNVHLHLDRASVLFSDQIGSDPGGDDAYPWAFSALGLIQVTRNSDFCDGESWMWGETGSAQATGNKLQLDLRAQTADICRVDFLHRDGEYPENFTVDVSNDNSGSPTNWTNVLTKSGNTVRDVHAVFTPQSVRHIRLILTGGGSRKWAVTEMKVYKKAGGTFFSLGTITEYGAQVMLTEQWATIWDAIHDLGDATGWHAWINPRTLSVNFDASRGSDLSSTIKFEENRNIRPTYRHQRTVLEKVDRVYVVGRTIGEEQLYAMAEVANVPADYRERVFLAAAITDTTILQTLANKLRDVLSSALEQIMFDARDPYATGSWDIGDLVQVNIPSKNISDKYRVLNTTRTFQGSTEIVTVEVASQAVIALKTLEQILTQSNAVAQMLLQQKIRDLSLQ
jgi:hypothetical protein